MWFRQEMEDELRAVDDQHRQVLRVANLETQKHPYHIRRTKQYYEMKFKGEEEIDRLTNNINEFEQEVRNEKENYQNALEKLEQISAEVKFYLNVTHIAYDIGDIHTCNWFL